MLLLPSKLRRKNGVALVVVLAFVVLLTGVVVAFITQAMSNRQLSNSSLHQSRSEDLCRSALDIIVSDLRQEIIDGSNPISTNYPPIYQPSSNADLMPKRNITPDQAKLMPSLLRRSDGVDPASRASAANSTSGASRNGRSISLARWNAHYLLPRYSSGASIDSTPPSSLPAPFNPNPANADGFTPPDWVFVTSNGPAVLSSPQDAALTSRNSVVGRYAYAIYDESGLLDVNCAGMPLKFPSNPTSPGAGEMTALQAGIASKKGYLGFADLTQLPDTGATRFTAAQAANLIGWRNYASSQPGGTFPNFKFDPDRAPMDRYTNSVLSNPTGFPMTNGTTWSGQSDRVFLSRQQLIAFQQGPAGFSQNVLQYLTTFSRAVTAPSWSPPADAAGLPNPAGNHYSPGNPSPTGNNGAGNIYAYKTNAQSDGSANRDLASIRFPNAGTITHYKDDASTTTYMVRAGDPYLKGRFSLARIAWLPHDGSSLPAERRTAVRDCFGLEWSSDAYGNPCWKYTQGTAGPISPQVLIKTLGEVAAEGREPNFFELLKAAVLTGSLGRDPGPTQVTQPPNDNWPVKSHAMTQGCGGTDFEKTSSLADAQIIQIGANIIDQFDADSYPTAIFFQGPNVDNITLPENGPLNVYYGIENLPYINKAHYICWFTSHVPAYVGMNAWIQPELWNPFQAPTVTTNRPTSFSVQAYGAAQLRWGGSAMLKTIPSPLWNYNPGGNGANEANIYFKDPLTSGASTFANPQILTTVHEDTSIKKTPDINRAPANPPNDSSPSNRFLALHCGFSPYGTTTLTTAPDSTHTWTRAHGYWINISVAPCPKLTLCLQYHDPVTGRFLPYTWMSRFTDYYGNQYLTNASGDPSGHQYSPAAGSTNPAWGRSNIGLSPFMHTDPLTDRFSGTAIDTSHYHWVNKNLTWQWSGLPASGKARDGYVGTGEYDAPWTVGTQAFYYDYTDYMGNKSTNGVPLWGNSGGAIALFYGTWAQNQPLASGNCAFYADRDGIVRPGNDCLSNSNKIDGVSQRPDGFSATTGTNTGGSTSNAAQTMGRRPLILNRPFRSVGELGYAYRDLPFKTLDFFSIYSADAALLDVFSVTDQPPVVAGQINPSNAPAPVLQAILVGAGKLEPDANYNINGAANAEGQNLASSIANYLSTYGPITNRADLVNKLGVVLSRGAPVSDATSSILRTGFSTSKNPKGDQANKTYLEAPVRALADVTNTRTWNLMIDVVAQTGVFSPNAPNTPAALNSSFVVQGERRYWLHIAIDRFSGKVIDQQLELVYE